MKAIRIHAYSCTAAGNPALGLATLILWAKRLAVNLGRSSDVLAVETQGSETP
jgi:hypothetical protein